MLTGALWLLQGGQTGKGSSCESGRRGLPRTPGKMALPELGWLDGLGKDQLGYEHQPPV